MIVVDSNVIAARCLTTVCSPWAGRVGERDAVWIAPPLWRYEFQNILAKALWVRQLALEDAVAAWNRAVVQLVDNEVEPPAERVLALSAGYRITAYDANFIGLALEMGVPCVTEDGELQEKFPAVALSMRAFLERGPENGRIREPRASYRVRKRRWPADTGAREPA